MKSIIMELPLGDRMKSYEKDSEKVYSKKDNIVVRIDGHKFSEFTSEFKKPFDDVFGISMINATKDLVERFECSLGYTQSDEITLIIPSIDVMDRSTRKSLSKKEKYNDLKLENWTHILGGREQKLVSLISSAITIRFNFHLEKELLKVKGEEDYVKKITKKLWTAEFDVRIFPVPNKEELLNSILWRCRDAEKNSVSNTAIKSISHKSLLLKNSDERIEMLKELGIDWNKTPGMYKYGTTIKREIFSMNMEDIKGVPEKYRTDTKVYRTRMKELYMKWSFSDENLKLITNRFVEEEI